MFGCSPREEPKDLVGDDIPPLPHLVCDFGFLLSCFFRHCAPHALSLQHFARPACPAQAERITLGIGQQENDRYQPETKEEANGQEQ